MQEIAATFWVDAKYKTIYRSKDYHTAAHLVPENLHTGYTGGAIVGNIASAVIQPFKEFFIIDRKEFERLLSFKRIVNSQVWICFIGKSMPSIARFWNVEELWRQSFREDKRVFEARQDVRLFEPMDPIEVPINASDKTIDLGSDVSLAKLFEPSAGELESHRDRIHKRGIWEPGAFDK